MSSIILNAIQILLHIFDDYLSLVELLVILCRKCFELLCKTIDEYCLGYEPWKLVLFSIIGSYLLQIWVTFFLHKLKELLVILISPKRNIAKFLTKLPLFNKIVDKKLTKMSDDLKKDLMKVYKNEEFLNQLPPRGLSSERLLKKNRHYQSFDTAVWQQGRISGAIYTNNSSQYNDLLLSIFSSHMWSNPLHSDIFASVRKMEVEIVNMVADMFSQNLPDKLKHELCGSVSSGGTESIILACKAYRDYAINVRNCLKHPHERPEILAPITAHAAFEKAANLLNCKFIPVPIDKKTYQVDVNAMRRLITHKTCMIVGSAPQFPHGIIDPIEKLSELAIKHSIPLHVDACLGGFLIAFMDVNDDLNGEKFDFSLPGVTSISVDTHKYGYAPKGTSVILYRNSKFIHQQYSVQTNWPGGIYASPTLPGSRPGALIATCWAALTYHGREGYVEATKKIIQTTRKIIEELNKIDSIRILGDPRVSIVAFTSDKFDIYVLNEKLKEKGWNLNALQFPSSIHLCVTLMHVTNNSGQTFVRDVRQVAEQLLSFKQRVKPSGSAAIYGTSQSIQDRSLVERVAHNYLDGCYNR